MSQPFANKSQLIALLGMLIAAGVMAVPGHIGSFRSWPSDIPLLAAATMFIWLLTTGAGISILILMTTSGKPSRKEEVEGQPVRQHSTFGCLLGLLALLGFIAILARLIVTKPGAAPKPLLAWAAIGLFIGLVLSIRLSRSQRTRVLYGGELHRFPDRLSALQFLLARDEMRWGPEHVRVAHRLRDIVEWYMLSGRVAEAETLVRRIVAIREKALGPGHIETGLGLLGLAKLRLLQGDDRESGSLLRRGMDVLRRASYFQIEDDGIPDRSKAAFTTLHAFAADAIDERIDDAATLCSLALQVRKASLPPNDPRLADAYRTSALFQRDHGQLDEARALMERAIALSGPEAREGVVDPALLTKEYADILHRMNKPEPEPEL